MNAGTEFAADVCQLTQGPAMRNQVAGFSA